MLKLNVVETGEDQRNATELQISPGNTVYYIPPCDHEFKPTEGKEFATIEQGKKFYKAYATVCGFVTRGSTNNKRNGETVWKYFVCNKEGEKKLTPKLASTPKTKKAKRRRLNDRTGCKARMILKRTAMGTYTVFKFEEKHTHPMLTEREKQFAKSNRHIGAFEADFVMNCDNANVGTHKSYRIYRQFTGSYTAIGATIRDFKNLKRDLNTYTKGFDGQMVIDKLTKKKEICDAFYFDYHVDKEDRLERMFWADPISRKSFSFFGDVVAADATYSKNR